MLSLNEFALFSGAALLMVLTPGPNMIYLISRSICQGRRAGCISLGGIVVGFLVRVVAASAGLSAVLLALPIAYELLKWAGAAFLMYLAWQAMRPGAGSPFEARQLPEDPPRRLFAMGFFTSALNPKIAMFYLSIFPQFVSPSHGSVMLRSLMLGVIQIFISFSVNLLITLSAARVALWFTHNQKWLVLQRYVMGFTLAGLAVKIATDARQATQLTFP